MISDCPGVLPIHRAGDIHSLSVMEQRHPSCRRQRYPSSDEVTGSTENRRAEDVIYPGLSKTFDSISHSIFVAKLGRYSLDG